MQNKHIVSLLRFAAFFLFFGRGWQHLAYYGPYDTLFFSKNFFGGLYSWITGIPYGDLLSNPNFAQYFDWFNDVLSIFFFLAAISVLFINKKNSWYKRWVRIGGYLLLFTAFGYYVEKKFVLGQFLEYTAQFATPYLLLMAVKYKMKSWFLFVAKWSIAITFVCHGLYAIGYYPIPGDFMNMVINYTGMTNADAELTLKIMGYADFAFAIGLFIPVVSKYVLWYGLLWGFLTAFARVYTNFDIDFLKLSFTQNALEFFIRIPHFILPLLLLRYKKEIHI